jgi:hypothetical protein
MTPKDKAIELVDMFSVVGLQQRNEGIQCALIAVDEIMKAVGWEEMEFGVDRDNYWEEVKEEIQKL